MNNSGWGLRSVTSSTEEEIRKPVEREAGLDLRIARVSSLDDVEAAATENVRPALDGGGSKGIVGQAEDSSTLVVEGVYQVGAAAMTKAWTANGGQGPAAAYATPWQAAEVATVAQMCGSREQVLPARARVAREEQAESPLPERMIGADNLNERTKVAVALYEEAPIERVNDGGAAARALNSMAAADSGTMTTDQKVDVVSSGVIAVESVVFGTVDSVAVGSVKGVTDPATMATADSVDSGDVHPGALVTVDAAVVAAADLDWMETVHSFVLKVDDMRVVVGPQKMASVGVGDWDTVPRRGQVPWGAWHGAIHVSKLSNTAIGGVVCYGGYYAVLGGGTRASPDVVGDDHTRNGESVGHDQHSSGDSTQTAGERPRVKVSSRVGGDGSNPYSRNFDRGLWSSADRFQRTARCDELKETLRSRLAELRLSRQPARVRFLRLLR
jgi:hypothetical protein